MIGGIAKADRTGQFPDCAGPTLARPSRDYTPLGGFIRREDRMHHSKPSWDPEVTEILLGFLATLLLGVLLVLIQQ